MKIVLLSSITAALIFIIYIACNDSDTILISVSIYSLVCYTIVKKIKGNLNTHLNEMLLMKLFLITAYAIFNYFVIRNALNFGGIHTIYATLWFLMSSGLIYFKWPTPTKNVKNT